MAKKIKETPVLTGDDASRFLENIHNQVKVSPEEYERIKENFAKMTEAFNRKKLQS